MEENKERTNDETVSKENNSGENKKYLENYQEFFSILLH